MGEKTKIEWTEATWNPIRGCSVVSEGCRNCYAMQVAARFSQRYWEVWQGSTLVSSAKQELTEAAARNKVENEARNGVVMEARESSEGQAYAGLAYRNSSGAHWTGKVRLIEEHLEDPLRWKRPRRIFVNSMSDLFHESIPDEWIDRIFAVMATAPHHSFQVLTKRAHRMRDYVNNAETRFRITEHFKTFEINLEDETESGRTYLKGWPLPNVWLGISVEDQKTSDERIPLLLQTPAAVRWISAEPLLGPINLDNGESSWLTCDGSESIEESCVTYLEAGGEHFRGIDWVVVGGESGPGARPMHPEWVRSIRDQCEAAGVPFFFKQWGEYVPVGPIYSDDDTAAHLAALDTDDGSDDHDDPRECHITRTGYLTRARFDGQPPPGTWAMRRVGKKAAGHLLDGREHREFPQSIIGENQNADSNI